MCRSYPGQPSRAEEQPLALDQTRFQEARWNQALSVGGISGDSTLRGSPFRNRELVSTKLCAVIGEAKIAPRQFAGFDPTSEDFGWRRAKGSGHHLEAALTWRDEANDFTSTEHFRTGAIFPYRQTGRLRVGRGGRAASRSPRA